MVLTTSGLITARLKLSSTHRGAELTDCQFSLIGRQMIVLGFGPSGRVTISNCEFDGRTSWSASCDGRHYWVILGYGNDDFVTFVGNYIHHTSGRSPRLDYNSLWHAVNNYWYSNSGHAFDVSSGANALIEGMFISCFVIIIRLSSLYY
jgi:hypothetical protein